MMEKYETDEENLDEVHKDKLTKNSCDAKKSKTIANIKNSVLQWKLSGQAFHIYDELQTIGLQTNNNYIRKMRRIVWMPIFYLEKSPPV